MEIESETEFHTLRQLLEHCQIAELEPALAERKLDSLNALELLDSKETHELLFEELRSLSVEEHSLNKLERMLSKRRADLASQAKQNLPDSASVDQWSTEETRRWVLAITGSPKIAAAFRQADISGELLLELTERDLADPEIGLNVDNKLLQRKLSRSLRSLKEAKGVDGSSAGDNGSSLLFPEQETLTASEQQAKLEQEATSATLEELKRLQEDLRRQQEEQKKQQAVMLAQQQALAQVQQKHEELQHFQQQAEHAQHAHHQVLQHQAQHMQQAALGQKYTANFKKVYTPGGTPYQVAPERVTPTLSGARPRSKPGRKRGRPKGSKNKPKPAQGTPRSATPPARGFRPTVPQPKSEMLQDAERVKEDAYEAIRINENVGPVSQNLSTLQEGQRLSSLYMDVEGEVDDGEETEDEATSNERLVRSHALRVARNLLKTMDNPKASSEEHAGAKAKYEKLLQDVSAKRITMADVFKVPYKSIEARGERWSRAQLEWAAAMRLPLDGVDGFTLHSAPPKKVVRVEQGLQRTKRKGVEEDDVEEEEGPSEYEAGKLQGPAVAESKLDNKRLRAKDLGKESTSMPVTTRLRRKRKYTPVAAYNLFLAEDGVAKERKGGSSKKRSAPHASADMLNPLRMLERKLPSVSTSNGVSVGTTRRPPPNWQMVMRPRLLIHRGEVASSNGLWRHPGAYIDERGFEIPCNVCLPLCYQYDELLEVESGLPFYPYIVSSLLTAEENQSAPRLVVRVPSREPDAMSQRMPVPLNDQRRVLVSLKSGMLHRVDSDIRYTGHEVLVWTRLQAVLALVDPPKYNPLALVPTPENADDSTQVKNYLRKTNMLLRCWLYDNYEDPHPVPEELNQLSVQTGMSVTQVKAWMEQARGSLLSEMEEERALRELYLQNIGFIEIVRVGRERKQPEMAMSEAQRLRMLEERMLAADTHVREYYQLRARTKRTHLYERENWYVSLDRSNADRQDYKRQRV